MNEACTHGARYVRDEDSFTRFHYDYSERCGNPATGSSVTGQPRCDEHRARRYMVMVGTSLAITRRQHEHERDARLEVLSQLHANYVERLGLGIERALSLNPMLARKLDLMSARPATDADIERWDALVEQDKAYKTKSAIRRRLSATG